VAVLNRSASPVTVTAVTLTLAARNGSPGAELRYDKLTVGVPAIRRPAPVLRQVRWTDEDEPGARRVAFAGPELPIADRYDLTLDVVAGAPGLWEYTVEATVRDVAGRSTVLSCETRLAVLLRGV
jgi:hypothetical protein